MNCAPTVVTRSRGQMADYRLMPHFVNVTVQITDNGTAPFGPPSYVKSVHVGAWFRRSYEARVCSLSFWLSAHMCRSQLVGQRDCHDTIDRGEYTYDNDVVDHRTSD